MAIPESRFEIGHLSDMTRGWFVGNFSPSMLATGDVEVAVQRFTAGSHEAAHFHKLATEITVILEGQAEMAGRTFSAGDIIKLPPGTPTDFRAITDVTTVVVKIPGATGDKYLLEH